MEVSYLNKPSTTSSPPSRLFQALPRLLPKSLATTKPKADPPSTHPRPSNVTIHPITPSTLPSFKRLTTLLFPIRYHDKFFTDILSDPTASSLSRIALWRASARPGKRKRTDISDSEEVGTEEEGQVVGGIRCRLEDVAVAAEGSKAEPAGKKQLYVQTLGVLSPYRTLGVASALLEEVVEVGMREFGIGSVYAHVWEANTEALEWYIRRGFSVEKALVEGYYRRLRPAGARIVRRLVGVGDYIRVGKKSVANKEEVHEVGRCGEYEADDEDTPGQIDGADDKPGTLGDEASIFEGSNRIAAGAGG